MMKRLLSILPALLAAVMLRGAVSPVERIFISTDREVYIAGDVVWCSLFCLDNEGRYSNTSAVSYLELVSSDGSVAQAKIGLLEGRGAGSFRIPVTVPTGVYRLVSYTSWNTNEDGSPWMAGSRILTIFNTTSVSRVKDGVEIVDASAYSSMHRTVPEEAGKLEFGSSVHVRKGTELPVVISNGGKAADISLSVFHDDGLVPAPQENSIASFLGRIKSSPVPRITGDRPLEYDGEIISARIRGGMTGSGERAMATLSCAGAPSNAYIGLTDNGRVRFMTNNIYGDREIVCEVSALEGKDGSIEFESPFIRPEAGSLPKLVLCREQYESLSARKFSLRNEKTLMLDTLATFFRHREDLLLEGSSLRHFHLDDYNRFPSVKEVLVELIPFLRLQRNKGEYAITMVVTDGTDTHKARVSNVIVMMDGVILSNLDQLVGFDAMLLEDVDVYQQAFVCGNVVFSGLVNFVTKKNYVAALSFPQNVAVVDYKGVSYPVAYYGAVPAGEGTDARQVLYWNPSLGLDAGEQVRVLLRAPTYSGRFRAVAEGLAEDGSPIHAEWTFEVE